MDLDDDITAAWRISESGGRFGFDQQAVDVAPGKNSFPLADFYSLDMSPGIVPEPSVAGASFAAVVALFALRHVRTNGSTRRLRQACRRSSNGMGVRRSASDSRLDSSIA
jgi:hypothetical protein